MKKQLLKHLITNSYKDGSLDQKRVFLIADLLSRQQLKQYITALKQSEKKQTVVITSATKLNIEQSKQLTSLFASKKVVTQQDPSLMLGMRIVENDDIVELNLQHELDLLVAHVVT